MCTLIHTTQDAGFTSMNECAGQWLCQQDASSTEENIFEAFCFRDQLSNDYDPAFTRPTSHGNTFMKTWPVPQRYKELDVGMLNADPKYSASQCTLNNSWEPSTESTSEAAMHPQSLMQGTPATVEAELEEDIQREIEAELKKEISLLSQKLAVLQARHGAQRMMEGPLPAVLSCPVTPVLTPRDSKETNVQSSNPNQSDSGAIGTRHRRGGPMVAAKQSRPKSEWKASMRPGIPSPGMKQNERMIHQDCSPQSNDYGLARAHEEFNNGDEHSVEGTPSSGSLNSNITDYVMKDPTIQNSHGGVPCPRVYPNNSRRFDWVKTLRSGETGSRVSSGTSVSSDKKPLKMPKTKRPLETKAECASKNQRDNTTGNWTNDLSDMTEMLENRLSDLAIRTTMACVQIPAPQDPEGTRSCGHVLTTKYLEPAADKSTKDLGSELLAEGDYGCLDRRTVLHLMKAGLKRGPIRKKIVHQSPYSKPRPIRTCNTHKDAANGKRGETACEKVSPEKQTQTDELKEIQQNTELVSPDTIKTECKTFLQSPKDRPKPSLHCDASERLHGEATRNGNSDMLLQSNQVLSTREKISQSQISILGSKEKQHPVKTTYMRIIELVADTGNQHSAKKSTHSSRQCLAYDKGSLSSLLMEVKHRAEDKTFKHDKGHISNITDASSLTTSRLRENIASAFKKGGQETIKKTSQHQKFVSRLSELQLSPESHTDSMDRRMGCKSLPMTTVDVMRDGVKETIRQEEQTECLATNRPISATDVLRSAIYKEKPCPHENWSPELMQDQEQLQELDGKLNRAISSSSFNGENHETDNDSAEASGPAISSIRARLKELIDALENERIRLPKIRTGIEPSISTSPRDSGRVKRIAERLQLVNLKVDETATPSDLQNNGQVYPEMTARVITASCNKIEAKCIKSAEVARVHDRQGQTTRKKTLQRQVLRVRRVGKQSSRAKDSNIQQNLNEDKKFIKKLRKKKTISLGNEIEGLNLESIWCLVEKLEGVCSSSAVASRTPVRHMRGQHCEEGA